MSDILINLLAFIIVFGVLVILHELGHFLTARLFKVDVEEFAFGMPPRLKAWKKGETEYAINAIPIGGYVRLLGEEEDVESEYSFQKKPPWQRLIILAAGTFVHLVLALVIFILLVLAQGQAKPNNTVEIVQINADSPAEQAGLQSGDVIAAVDDQRVYTVDEFISDTQAAGDKTVQLTLLRADEILHVSLTPRTNPPENEGRLGVYVTEGVTIYPVSFLTAVKEGTSFTLTVSKLTLQFAGKTVSSIFSKGKIPAEISGPVGVAKVSGDALKEGGITGLVFILGILAANLAVFNILPIPGLDGGRILFLLIEWARGKKIPPEKEAVFHGVGVALVLLLMAAVTYRDILKIFGL